MRIVSALECIAGMPQPESFARLSKDVAPEWIEEALLATGAATVRRRRLPAEQVPWLVIGMALMRDRPITEVVNSLDLALPSPTAPLVARSSVAKARDRLGETPMAWLFQRTATEWAHASADQDRWRGHSLYGVDGTTLRVPDSEENRGHFGLAGGRDSSGYPVVRLAALMALRSHLIAAASFGPYGRSEIDYAEDLWACFPDDSLVVADRGFWAANILFSLSREGSNRHWLTRAKSNFRGALVRKLGPGDELVECEVSAHARGKDPSLPRTWTIRVVEYERKGFPAQKLLTSLLDPDAYPASELIALYHERWEIELGYDEVKTEMLHSDPLRSKSVDRIRQEIWGILIAYNLVRLEMERVADEADVAPTRISFVAVYRLVMAEWIWSQNASPGSLPKHLRKLRQDLKAFILPPRRSERSYPRAVKVKMSNYKRKRRPSARARPG